MTSPSNVRYARVDLSITVCEMSRLSQQVVNESYDGERERIHQFSPLARNRETAHLWKDMTCYLGNPLVDFVGLARSMGVEGAVAADAGDLRAALRRAQDVNAEGAPFLIDLKVMQKGHGANDNWHPPVSIASRRTRRV